jgi:hypothetical protein
LEIFYVVSKIEPQESDSSGDEDEEDYGTVKETVQDSKKRRVYEQLVKNGFLSPDKDMHSNENFHGLSAWKLFEHRRKKKENPKLNDSDYKEYTDAFERFQSCLKTFSESSLKESVKRCCQKLISVLSRCLYFFIERANVLKQDRDAMIAMLKSIEAEEKILHRNIFIQIQKQKEEILEVMANDIEDLKDNAAEDARAFQYSEEFVVPAKDGFKFVKGAEAVNQFRMQIEQMVFNKVEKRVKDTLVRMFATRGEFLENLVKKVKTIEKEAFPIEHRSNAALATLYSNLVFCYEPDVDCKKGDLSIKRIIKHMVEWIKRLVKQPSAALHLGKVNVGDPEWKAKVALDTLSAIDLPRIGEEVVKTLNCHFNSCHERFGVELKKIIDVFTSGETLKDDQRKGKIIVFRRIQH